MKGSSFWKQGVEDHWFVGYGHYLETYQRRDGRWVFASCRLKYIHTRTSRGGVFPPRPRPSSTERPEETDACAPPRLQAAAQVCARAIA